jgi:hypothetical protein
VPAVPTVDLVYTGSEGGDGAIVGAVEIFDEDLVVVAGTVLRARRPVSLELAAGRYLTQGFVPCGGRVRAAFDATTDTTVRLDPRSRERSSAAPPNRPSCWLRGWSYRGRTWQPDLSVRCLDNDDVVEVQVPGDADALSVAFQIGVDGCPPHTVVTPPDTPVLVSWKPRPDGRQWHVRPADGVGHAVLEYLHRGEPGSADIVVRHAFTEADSPDGMPGLTALAIGYHLVLSGDRRAGRWIDGLSWRWPDSVDVAVLIACLLRGQRAASEDAIMDEFVRAAAGGIPVVSKGLRMLVAGLATAVAHPRAHPLAHLSEVRLRPYANTLVNTAMTEWRGASPNEPSLDRTPWTGSPPADAVVLAAQTRSDSAEPPRPSAPARTKRSLEEALRRLRTAEFGRGLSARRIEAEDIVLLADITRRETKDLLDLTITVEGPADELSDVVIDLDVDMDSTLHCLATFDRSKRCTFTGVPLGHWELSLRPAAQSPYGGRALPMPAPGQMALAASVGEANVVLRTLLPDGQGLALLRHVAGGHELEIMTMSSAEMSVFGVGYGRRHHDEAAYRLVPLVPRGQRRVSSTLVLDRFDVDQPWFVQPGIKPAALDARYEDAVRASVRWATSHGSLAAWDRLSTMLPTATAAIVQEEITQDFRNWFRF